MYAVVEYNNCRKEQDFEIKMVTYDLDYAKKVAFQNAKKDLSHLLPKLNTSSMFKITTNNNEEYYLQPLNNVIIEYKIIEVKKTKNRFQLLRAFSTMYSVVQIEKEEKKDQLEEIDETMICNDYLSCSYEEEEEEEEEDNNKWNHVYVDEEDAILFKFKKD